VYGLPRVVFVKFKLEVWRESVAKLVIRASSGGFKTMTNTKRKLMLEALRRYTRFHKGESLTASWTGLGFVSEYKPVVAAGLMESATDSQPRCMRWFRLTDAGAAIVKGWLDKGFDYRTVEERPFEIPR
jgi:hypothetical protein